MGPIADDDPDGGDYGVSTGGGFEWGPGDDTYVFAATYGLASMGDEMTTTFTWDGAVGTEPPLVVIKETAMADWSGNSGHCDCGITTNLATQALAHGVRKTGVRYTTRQNPPHSFTVTCTPSGDATYTTPISGLVSGGVDVSYTASATPVTIESNFAVVDNDGSFNFLVGQQADFYVASGNYTQSALHYWTFGSNYVGSVTFGEQGESSQYGPFYDSRTTSYSYTSSNDTGDSHPSIYFEGEERTVEVECNIELYDGSMDVGAVTVTRNVNIARPVCSMTVSSTGPCAIYDVNPNGIYDEEWEDARDQLIPYSGFWIDGSLCLPTLFVTQQGEGTWSYVQLCSRQYSLSGGTPVSESRGLDTSYPYAASYFRPYSQDQTTTWRSTHGEGALSFYDAPGIQISGKNAYDDSFHGDCYGVLRPPHWSGQSYVELPDMKLSWDYISNSSRLPDDRWVNEGTYRSSVNASGNTVWSTTPNGASLTPGAMQQPVASEDMDWTLVNS